MTPIKVNVPYSSNGYLVMIPAYVVETGKNELVLQLSDGSYKILQLFDAERDSSPPTSTPPLDAPPDRPGKAASDIIRRLG